MYRKRLVATAAAAPLLIFAPGAWAETTITTAVTTPVATSDTNDDVRVTSSGSIKPTVAGPALEMDTSHDITNEGTISTTDVNGSIGMQAHGGLTGDVTNKGAIQIVEDYTPTDTDEDGDLDGPFAQGSNRHGIQVVGPGTLTGSVLNDTGASIQVEGNTSAGISIETVLNGSLTNNGSISVVGDQSYGVHTTDTITGNVTLNGSIAALGEDSEAVSLEGDVGGALTIQGSISARGFRSANRPQLAADRAKLDADDLLLGGPAVRVGGNVTNGILIDVRPADLDPDDDDEDNDGIDDAQEGNGAITVFGTAPALLIGSATQDITIGAVGTGDNAYGLIAKGSISADGVYDDFAATALQIGDDPAFDTTIAGGIRLDGAVSARAFDADSTAIVFNDGAALTGAGEIWNTGTITSQLLDSTPPPLPAPLPGVDPFTATAIQINAGASVAAIRNDGVIATGVFGENSDSVAIRDLSGTLTTIDNTGRIQAVITPNNNNEILGTRIAIDVAANTTGVTVSQAAHPDADEDAEDPLIFGNVLFGSGADSLLLGKGQLIGDVSFGDGADTLSITGGAVFNGKITDSDGLLDINLTDGRLIATGTDTLTATSLDVGADGVLIVTVNADTEAATRFNVDTANFATGSQIGVRLEGLLTFDNLNTAKNFVIVDAGTLTAGEIDDSLLGISPFLFNVGVTADEDIDQVLVSVRRRTAEEAGLNAAQAAAFDPFYVALSEDEAVREAFLARFSREGFLQLYNQMLPDQGEGLFSALEYAHASVARAVAVKPDPRRRYGPDSFWIQELNVQVQRDGGDTLGSEAKGFGFVGGYEAMDDKGGALGVTLAYMNAEENDDAAQVGEQTTVSLVEAGAYWRRAAGAWLFSVRGGAGYAFFDGTRRFVAPAEQTIREATAEWNGFTAAASASAGYEARFGRYYVRPAVGVDYFYLREGERQEEGWEGLNQTVDERTSSRLSASADVTLGAEYGREFWWRPEVKAGFRQVLAGEVGDTVFRFGGGDPVTLVAMDPGDTAAVLGLALRAGTAMSYLAAELEMERVKNEQRYKALLSGRVMF